MPPAAVRPTFGRVALIGKLRSAEIAESLRELRGMLEKRGCEVLIERETASDLGLRGVDYAAIGADAATIDKSITFGKVVTGALA